MLKKLLLLLFISCISYNTFALPYKNIIFFGDSLSDNGNLYDKIKIPKSPPYYKGRFSNGPTWAELVGNYFHDQYNTQYKVFAMGSATAIIDNPIADSLGDQIKKYLKSNYSTEDTLYTIWIGANDYLDEKKQNVNELVNDVINEITRNTTKLIDKGAKSFLIMDLPDLSKIPYATTINNKEMERLSILSKLHHEKLTEAMQKLQQENPSITFYTLDVYTFFNEMVTNPEQVNRKYNQHLSNTNAACWPGGYIYQNNIYSGSTSVREAEKLANAYDQGAKPCESPDNYIFWDKLHPTAVVHTILSELIKEKLSSY